MNSLLAIDPGPQNSALVALDDNGKINAAKFVPNSDVISICETHLQIACEMVACYGMPVGAEVFETVLWIGQFKQAAEAKHSKFHLVYRKDVKMFLCQNMRAKDANIRQALIDKLGPQGTKKAPGPTYGISKHSWSALAVGVTFLGTRGPL